MRKKKKTPDDIVLVPVSLRHRARKRIYTVLAVVLVILAAYVGGEIRGRDGAMRAERERDFLLQQVQQLQQQLSEARQQAAIHKAGTEVTREAEEQVRQQIKALTSQVAELEEAVAFYKNVMSPGSTDKGVHIESFDLVATSEAGLFLYKLVLTQRGDNRYHLRGDVQISLVGRNSVEPVTISQDVPAPGSDTAFRFRYFQELTGSIRLPEDFQPEQVLLKASAKGNRPSTAERSFVWQIKEREQNVWTG